jgi:hypothetical protein
LKGLDLQLRTQSEQDQQRLTCLQYNLFFNAIVIFIGLTPETMNWFLISKFWPSLGQTDAFYKFVAKYEQKYRFVFFTCSYDENGLNITTLVNLKTLYSQTCV